MEQKEKNPSLQMVNNQMSKFNRIVQEAAKSKELPYNARTGILSAIFPKGWNTKATYTLDDIEAAKASKDVKTIRRINNFYYQTNTSYKRIVDYFAYIYKYYYTLDMKNISLDNAARSNVENLYRGALQLLDGLEIADTFGTISKKVLLNGAFYGYVNEFPDNRTVITELDLDYCRSLNKSVYNTALVEFNLTFFSRYEDADREATLQRFPPIIRQAWDAFASGKRATAWLQLPPENSCAFFMDDGSGETMGEGVPVLFDVLGDILNFEDYKKLEKAKDASDLDKLLVQQFKYDGNGDLEVLLEEMAEMHKAAANMLADRDNIDLLTSLADTIQILDTQSSSRLTQNNIQKMLQPKYESAGLSYEVFASTGATSLERSLQNTTSFMSQLVEKYSVWLSMYCYSHFNFGKIIPIVTILPITWYNEQKMMEEYLKGAQYGFSWILPYVAMGKKQSTLLDTVYLEQDILKLKDKMRPLSNSFTETDNSASGQQAKKVTSGTPGRPPLANEERTEKTVANIEAKS